MINYAIQPEKQSTLSTEIWNRLIQPFQSYAIVTADIMAKHLPAAIEKRIFWYTFEPLFQVWQQLSVDIHHPSSVQAFLDLQQVVHQQVYLPFSQFSRWLQKAIQEWLDITAQPIPYLKKTYFESGTTLLPISILQITKEYWAELSLLLEVLIRYLEKNYQKDIDAMLFEAKLYKIASLLQQKGILSSMVTWWEYHLQVNPVQYGAWLLETQPIRMKLPEARLRQYIPINDQFEYITQLFNGDREQYIEVLKFAERHSYPETEAYIKSIFEKNYVSTEQKYAQKFLEIVKSFIEQRYK
ncbi:MAG: hypothetical protein NZ519_10380 [Bacteroidia bacterium]|nr:hypothetical protein [Bacteroidia bacterium]MDW8302893.1 hypothetical protein [Bacteroidia bacterium]